MKKSEIVSKLKARIKRLDAMIKSVEKPLTTDGVVVTQEMIAEIDIHLDLLHAKRRGFIEALAIVTGELNK